MIMNTSYFAIGFETHKTVPRFFTQGSLLGGGQGTIWCFQDLNPDCHLCKAIIFSVHYHSCPYELFFICLLAAYISFCGTICSSIFWWAIELFFCCSRTLWVLYRFWMLFLYLKYCARISSPTQLVFIFKPSIFVIK